MCVWFISIGYIRILLVEIVQKRKVALEIKPKQEIISKYNSGTKSKELAAFTISMLHQSVLLYQAYSKKSLKI